MNNKISKESYFSGIHAFIKMLESKPIIIGIIIGLVSFTLLAFFLHFKVLDGIDLLSLNWRFRNFHNNTSQSDQCAVIGINTKSTFKYSKEYGDWPWSRKAYADLVDAVNFYGAKSISFDLYFPTRKKSDMKSDILFTDAVKNFKNNNKYFTIGTIVTSIDIEKKETIGNLNTVSVNNKTDLNAVSAEEIFYQIGETDKKVLNLTFEIQKPFKELLDACMSIGMVNIYSRDTVINKIPLFIKYHQLYFATISLETYLESHNDPEISQGKNYIKVNNKKIPTLEDNLYLINWYKPPEGTNNIYLTVPIEDVIDSYKFLQVASKQTGLTKEEIQQQFDQVHKCIENNTCSQELIDFVSQFPENAPAIYSPWIKNKYLFLGLMDKTGIAKDTITTPFQDEMPGVYLHVTILDNILQNHFLHKASNINTLIVMFILTIFTGITLLGIKDPKIGIGTGSLYLLYCLLPICLFKYYSVVADIVYTEASIFLTFIGCITYQLYKVDKDKKLFKSTFSNYLAPQIMTEILSDPSKVELGGDSKEITILFSDIRGFTTISEHSTPKEVVMFLNEYFDEMVEAITQNEGTIDKFIGDAIMAFWGAPVKRSNHAELAIRGALDMINRLEKLKEKWKSDGKDYPEINIGIGINTGEAVVGNIGSSKIKSYTVIGDSVNLASRLEGLNKKYATCGISNKCILISEFTYEQVKDIFDVDDLGYEKVKGKDQQVKIYKVRGIKGE
ncbi:MAG: adenylate/guanylate cyclase domain-containing protein [Cyanobacteriota bacterium]